VACEEYYFVFPVRLPDKYAFFFMAN
jgi:hypothetical protein